MAEFYLIRHSMTKGNLEKRYVGSRTDEPLCREGIALLEGFSYPAGEQVERVIVSPMRRCVQTAQILFPGKELVLEPGLMECDFGAFENKNYEELSGDPAYQEWIDSNGTMPFPGGESMEGFQKRCREQFARILEACLEESVELGAFVVHGGTIMSILSGFSKVPGDYFSWQVKNGEGFQIKITKKQWKETGKIEVTGKIQIVREG